MKLVFKRKRIWITRDKRLTIRLRIREWWITFAIGKPEPFCLAICHRLNRAAWALCIIDLKIIAFGLVKYNPFKEFSR